MPGGFTPDVDTEGYGVLPSFDPWTLRFRRDAAGASKTDPHALETGFRAFDHAQHARKAQQLVTLISVGCALLLADSDSRWYFVCFALAAFASTFGASKLPEEAVALLEQQLRGFDMRRQEP